MTVAAAPASWVVLERRVPGQSKHFSVVGEPNVAAVLERRYKTLVACPAHVAANDLCVILYRADFASCGRRFH